MAKVNIDEQKVDEILERGTIVKILPDKKEFREKLLSGQKMRFYIGFDPTAPILHLSHAKNFILMEKFRQLGHEAIILFGDFTAMIGDPTGEKDARKQLSRGEIAQNVKKWKELIKPLINFDGQENPPKLMYNSEWLSKLKLEDLTNLAGNFTVQQMIERDMFQKRLKEKKPIYLHEFLYPLMQGYDSVVMNVDVEVCGNDQIFNALIGRTLLKKLTGKDKYIVAVTLMENPKTGELMSKSKEVGVFLGTSAKDIFGQIMAQPDEMIEILFVNNTYLSLKEIKNLLELNNSRDAKMRLALEVTKIFHGEEAAEKAKEEFIRVFSKKEAPEEAEILILPRKNIIDSLAESGAVKSKSEARRLINTGAIEIGGEKISDLNYLINEKNEGKILQRGKKRFYKIKIIC